MRAGQRPDVAGTVRRASAVLMSRVPAAEAGAALGKVDVAQSARRLVLVEPSERGWRRIQVVADEAGDAVELVFELADGVTVTLDQVSAVLGVVVDEEIVPDGGGARLTFATDAATACRVSVSAARSGDGTLEVRALSIARI